jgi:hypothetical protein
MGNKGAWNRGKNWVSICHCPLRLAALGQCGELQHRAAANIYLTSGDSNEPRR